MRWSTLIPAVRRTSVGRVGEAADMQPETGTAYQVVVNHEVQYSIWPTGRELPPGWRPQGAAGTREECLARIDEVWTDMRPLSLRQRIGG
jgi:MbtH protein